MNKIENRAQKALDEIPATLTNVGSWEDDFGGIVEALKGLVKLTDLIDSECRGLNSWELSSLLSMFVDRLGLIRVQQDAKLEEQHMPLFEASFLGEMLEHASNPAKDEEWIRKSEDIRGRFHEAAKDDERWLPYKDIWCDFFTRMAKAITIVDLAQSAKSYQSVAMQAAKDSHALNSADN